MDKKLSKERYQAWSPWLLTDDQWDALREQCIHLGKTTLFSAYYVSDAQIDLACKGFSVEEALTLLPGMLLERVRRNYGDHGLRVQEPPTNALGENE